MRAKAAALLVLAASCSQPKVLVASLRTDPAAERTFIDAINAERAKRSLARWPIAVDLMVQARAHSVAMANAGKIYHSSNTELVGRVADRRRVVGENVGRTSTNDPNWLRVLHDAFMESPEHRGNILADYEFVGVGVVLADDQAWVTQVFVALYASPLPIVKPSPAPTPKCEPVSAGCSYRLVPG